MSKGRTVGSNYGSLGAMLAIVAFSVGCGSTDKGTTATTTADVTIAPDVAVDVEAPDTTVDVAAPDASAEDVTTLPDLSGGDVGPGPDTGSDTTSPDVTTADTGTCSEGGCPCSENAQCQSGYCLDDAGTGQCATPCAAGCPAGTSCKTIKAGADDVAVCMPKFPRLCEPCNVDGDCQGGAAGVSALCIDYGDGKDSPGKFCGGSCDDVNPCPAGYSCAAVKNAAGATVKQCKRDDLTCSCDARAVKLGLSTTCSSTNGFGTCSGKKFCDDKGLSECSAAPASAEVCDGVDNDCDGQTDEASCDDKNGCTADSCDPIAKKCNNTPVTQPCDDGSVCTTKDTCTAGVCTGTLKDCDDGNPCTDDTCDTKAGCQYADATGPCKTDNPCESGATCKEGQCQGAKPKICNDNNACTADSCLDGVCQYMQVNAPCDDGNVCTTGDLCDAGSCAGKAKICNDNNPCTDDSCDATGCKFDPVGVGCDDGNACTTKDFCSGGVCTGATAKCDDGKVCTLDSCDPAKGCVYTAVAGGCDDGNPCTVGDNCQAGGCVAGDAAKCDDANPCTSDSCDPSKGCVFANNSLGCSDNDTCTVGDVCSGGKCVGGANQCGCQADADCAKEPQNACSGKLFCDKSSLPFKCVPDAKTALVCNTAGDTACAQTVCDPSAGACVTKSINESGLCNDGNACTVGDSCKNGACTPAGQLDCEDNNVCTDDTCVKTSGCAHVNNTAACNDGDPCTKSDNCSGGQCKGLGGAGCCVSNLDCDDKNACTVDTCLPSGACKNDAVAADGQACAGDGNGCTVGDTCQAGQCVVGKAADCSSAADACNDGVCKSTGPGSYQCDKIAKVDGLACNDGLFCTSGETCTAGKCGGGKVLDCSATGCTTGTCDEATKGCKGTPKPDGTACDADSDGCTKNDACSAGKCVAGAKVDCANPTDVCNDWGCKSTGAATYQCQPTAKPLGSLCEDGKFCTEGDSCDGAGKCVGGPAKPCSEVSNACNDGSCDEVNKKCVPKAKADGSSCNDGDVCTPTDACKAGVCLGQNNQCGDVKVSTFKTVTGATLATARAAAILDLGGGRYRVAWGNSDTVVSTSSHRDDGSRENAELSYTFPNVIRNVGLANGPAGASDVMMIADYNDSGSCYTCYSSCTTSNGCGIGYTSSCTTHSRYNGKSNFQWQRQDAWLVNSGGAVNVLSPVTVSCSGSTVPLAFDKFVSASYADGKRLVVYAANGTVTKRILNADNTLFKDLGSDATMKQYDAAVASDNSSIITWSDGAEIYAQLYYADGSTNGTKFQVNTNAAGVQSVPRVAYQPSGRYIVAWQTDVNNGDVAMQVFKPDPGVPINSEVAVNTTTTGYQGAPAIAVYQDGSFGIAWEDGSGKDGAGYGIVGQWFTSTGAKVGSEKVINVGATGDQRYVVGRGLSSDVGVFAWTNLADGHIYARRYDKLGIVFNGAKEIVVNTTKTGEQGNPTIATTTGGAFAVAWDSEGVDGDGTGVVLQRFGADGTLVGGETVVNTFKTGSQITPAVGMDTAGNYVVVWDSVGQDGDIDGIYGQRFKGDGSKNGAEFQVSQTTANDQWRPSVAMLADGSFATAWESYGQTGGNSYDIVMRCYDGTGAPVGNEQIVNSTVTDKQQYPNIIAFPDGKYLVVWQSFNEDKSGWGVYGQLMYKDCKAIGGQFAINTTTTSDQTTPRAAVDANGNFAVVWASLGQDGDNFGIYAQQYDKNGVKVGAEFKLNPLVAGEQSKPAPAYLANGNLVTVWQTTGEDESGYALKSSKFKGTVLQSLDSMVNVTYASNQSQPSILARADGTYIVVWRSDAQDGSKGTVVARILK